MNLKSILTVALLSLGSVVVLAQNKRISGKVVDTNGDPVIGAGVTQPKACWNRRLAGRRISTTTGRRNGFPISISPNGSPGPFLESG